MNSGYQALVKGLLVASTAVPAGVLSALLAHMAASLQAAPAWMFRFGNVNRSNVTAADGLKNFQVG